MCLATAKVLQTKRNTCKCVEQPIGCYKFSSANYSRFRYFYLSTNMCICSPPPQLHIVLNYGFEINKHFFILILFIFKPFGKSSDFYLDPWRCTPCFDLSFCACIYFISIQFQIQCGFLQSDPHESSKWARMYIWVING